MAIQDIHELHELLRQSRDSSRDLPLALTSCATKEGVIRRLSELTPRWVLVEQRQKRGTGVPVDLGLSVLWSSRNVGAVSGEQPGFYVGWGDETAQKTSTDLKDYPCAPPPRNICGGLRDIARHRWKETWRLPTRAEVDELINKCQWIWTCINGMWGFQVVGTTRNSIFLPATGSRYGQELEDYGYCGRYWTGEASSEDNRQAYMLEFGQQEVFITRMQRFSGLCVRPVLEKKKK